MLLQSALEVALSVIRANPTVLEGLGAYLEGNLLNYLNASTLLFCFMPFDLPNKIN